MEDILSLFPETYEASRERFRHNLAVIQKEWPNAKLSHHRIEGDELHFHLIFERKKRKI